LPQYFISVPYNAFTCIQKIKVDAQLKINSCDDPKQKYHWLLLEDKLVIFKTGYKTKSNISLSLPGQDLQSNQILEKISLCKCFLISDERITALKYYHLTNF
jgi:hypothetical protein